MNKLVSYINYSCLGLLLLILAFLTFEPAMSLGATTDQRQFTVSQTISKEVSITSSPSNVTMSPSLGGLSGGTANGETQFAVLTNSLTGYTLTIQASSTTGAMQGTASTTNFIPGYATSTPDYNMTVAVNKAAFAYTIQASSSADVTQMFRENGSVCNTGSSHTNNYHCWIQATSTAVTIINRSLPTATAATSTLAFRVIINSNPSPIIPNDSYIATTTITATVN